MGVMGQGLVLMVFGMTVVYLFLWLMIVVVKHSSRFVVKFDYLIPDDPKPKRRAVQAPAASSASAAAVPMAARVSNKVALEDDPTNFILMQAMGPNVSGVIGSAVVAGILYTLCR